MMLTACMGLVSCTSGQAHNAVIDEQERGNFYYGTVIRQTVSGDETISGKPSKYEAILLDEPANLVVFFEDFEVTHQMNRVRVIQLGDHAELLSNNVNKRVRVNLDDDCKKSMSPYVYEDVICPSKGIKVLN